MEAILTHKWQEQGLGVAPFRAVCVISLPDRSLAEANTSVYNTMMAEACQEARGFGVGLGTCDSCGMALQNNFVIRDANGKHFVVGCDCVRKTEDAKLVDRAEYLEKQRQKAIREAKRQAAWEARRAAQEAELQAQRDRNGGLTDAEAAAKQRAEAEEQQRKQVTAENGWLLDVLSRVLYQSNFVDSLMNDLQSRRTSSLSDRCLAILAEIYAKTASGSRKGSKAYNAAEEAFWSKVR